MIRPKVIDKAIFLDFDGVLFDTVREAYCVCMLAAGKLRYIDNIDFESEHFKVFDKYRFLITCAGDYYYLLKTIDKKLKNKKVNIEKEFKYQKNSKPGVRKAFEKDYFKRRKYLRSNNYQYWLSLNKPYKFLHILANLMRGRKNRFFIITTKDKQTVLRLLSINGVAFFKGNIYDNKSYQRFNSKSNIIRFVLSRYRIRKAFFVDDSKEHLLTCKGIRGLSLAQARWGYGPKHRDTLSETEAAGRIKKILGD